MCIQNTKLLHYFIRNLRLPEKGCIQYIIQTLYIQYSTHHRDETNPALEDNSIKGKLGGLVHSIT